MFCSKVNWNLQHASCYLCFSIDSLMGKCLPSYTFSTEIIISRLKIRNFFNLSYWANLYSPTKAPGCFDWRNRKNDMNFFVNILWIFSYPNYSSKIGFMTQHYVLENFHAPFKFLLPRSQALIMTSPLLIQHIMNFSLVKQEQGSRATMLSILTLAISSQKWIN